MKPNFQQTIQKPLTMSFAGGLIKHLGLQMYSGPVAAIAELIANTWDAMAVNVWITLPVNRSFKPSDEIIVNDDGHGMTYEECNDKYLVIGRDRRREEGDLSQPYKNIPRRRLMSRKGIGKLAGFGIANKVEVRTVKDGHITHFLMDFEKMTKGSDYVREYKPDLLADNGKSTTEIPGTKIILKNLKITRPIDEVQFRLSMARRFTILSDPRFSVFENEKIIQKTELQFQFRYPEGKGSWESEKIKGVGTLEWWIGFTKKPIPDDEARGIVVFTRGKLAQAPWFFDMSGGTYGQHGMQYMTGEIQAEFLDVTDGEDLIATDRQGALWDDSPTASALKEWGLSKIKELLKEWAERRQKDKRERPEIKKYLTYGEKLPEREKKIFYDYVHKLTSIPQIDKDEEILDELVKFGYNALTNRHFLDVIKQINAASPADVQKMIDILSEWDIIEAIITAQKVRGRVEIIRKFRKLIEVGVREKPDMQEYIKEHPWLIDPGWEMLAHERSIDRWLFEKFGIPKTGKHSGKTRPDYFCIGDTRTVQIVDLKRPHETIGLTELDQIEKYVFYVRDRAYNETSAGVLKKDIIEGILIGGKLSNEPGVRAKIDSLRNNGIRVTTWDYLLRVAETLHHDFLDIVKKRAPSDDPRIKALNENLKPKKLKKEN